MAKLPNFLVIMSDQHAPDALGGLGHRAVRTPAIDGLMADGVTFTNAYCPYPMCTPSRAGFMTGLQTPAHGVWELGTPLRSDLPTWPHALRHAGYQTSISGRMHFIGQDHLHGFERRVHPQLTQRVTPSVYGHWDRPQADDHIMVGAVKRAGPTTEPTPGELYDNAVTAAALAELDHLTATDQPWALTVGLFLPHIPYAVSQPWYDLYADREIPLPRPPPNGRSYEDLVPPMMYGCRRWLGLSDDGLSDAEIVTARRCYYGMISHLDAQVGQLVSRLEALGARDHTWVVYTSDHGDNMGEHGFWSKLNFFADSVGIPLVVAPPRCTQAGARCAAPVSLLDWLPTILDVTGQDFCAPLPGHSLLPLLTDATQLWPAREIISDYACDGTRTPLRMVRRGRWKACFGNDLPPLLFDLENDPHEWQDLGTDPASAPILAELFAIATGDGWEPLRSQVEVTRHKLLLDYICRAESKA